MLEPQKTSTYIPDSLNTCSSYKILNTVYECQVKNNNLAFFFTAPRRRRLFTSRRRGRVTPPSQRNSQMASLTERFLAIEEKRAETDLIVAQNQRLLTNAMLAISESSRDLVILANRRFNLN